MQERICKLTGQTFQCPDGCDWVISPEAYKTNYLPIKYLYSSLYYFLRDMERSKQKKTENKDRWQNKYID